MLVQLREFAVRRLRGSHNSVRHRFFSLPAEHLKYRIHLLRGGTWTDYYRGIVDRSASGQRFSDEQFDTAIADSKNYLDFLVTHGLRPQHSLLDYGCGTMRLGVLAIVYLTEGRYAGADISGEALKAGTEMLRKRGFSNSMFDAIKLSDCKLLELQGRSFDIVFANSVLTHMPNDEISSMFHSMKANLNPGGKFFFTYSNAEKSIRLNFKDFFHTNEAIAALVTNAGYEFSRLEDFEPAHVAYETMGIATLPECTS